MESLLIDMSSSRWRVLQPAIYLVSILPGLVCGLLFNDNGSIPAWVGMTCAVVFIQHGINVFNDETDWKKGADGDKKNSWYHFHQGHLAALKTHAWISLVLGTALGLIAVIAADRAQVLWVALPLVVLGYFYNHSKWTLSYTHLGEWVTGLCYGPGVFGCMAYVLTGQLSATLALGSAAFSCLAVSVLLSHQPPQILTDFAAGKASFAVRNGAEKTYRVAQALLILCLFLIAILFSMREYTVTGKIIPVFITAGLVWWLPKQLSPPIVLKAVSLQIAALGLFSHWSST